MVVKDLIEYLSQFDDNTMVYVVTYINGICNRDGAYMYDLFDTTTRLKNVNAFEVAMPDGSNSGYIQIGNLK